MSDIQSPVVYSEVARKAQINIRLSEFEIPPMQDALLIGLRAPIGPEAVRRMADAMSPEQYEIIKLNSPIFEAIVIKKSLLKQIDQNKLLPIIVEESARIANLETVVKAQISITIEINRSFEL